MLKGSRKISALTVSALILGSASAMAESSQYLVLFKNNKVPASISADVEKAGGKLKHKVDKAGLVVVSSDDDKFVAKAQKIKGIASVGLDIPYGLPETTSHTEATAPTASDVFFNDGGLWGIERVKAPETWSMGVTGSHDTVVAVIDTGIATNHPDLTDNVVYTDCYTSMGTKTSGGCNPYPAYSDHGTHVAGTIAASFGGGALVGVAPNVGLASYNTFEYIAGCGVCSYTSSRVLAMMDAAERGFEVISMSLGGTGQFGGGRSSDLATSVAAEQRVASMVAQMGTTIVASAGNSGLNLNGTIVHVPGDAPGIINTSATGLQPTPYYDAETSFDVMAFYSNYGAAVTLAAPGGDCGQIGVCDGNRPANWFEHLILSAITAPDPACAATESCPVGYGWKAGTSMATPHVSGVAALVKSVNPGLSPKQVQSILKRSAENLHDRQAFGHGMVNAEKAVQLALQ